MKAVNEWLKAEPGNKELKAAAKKLKRDYLPRMEKYEEQEKTLAGRSSYAKAFLPAVAQALGTQIILPDHYEVANAVGTVVGNVLIRQEGEVAPVVEGSSVIGYFARAINSQWKFKKFEEALSIAHKQLIEMVAAEAIQAGAQEPLVECVEKEVLSGMMVKLSA